MFVDRLSASNRCLQVHQGYTPEHMAADRKPQYDLYASQAIPEPFSSDEPADYRESEILFLRASIKAKETSHFQAIFTLIWSECRYFYI